MKIEVPLNEESVQLIQDTFTSYQEDDKIPKVLYGRTIIHVYPKKDTINEDGEYEGFYDSLFFNFDIYNTDNEKVYKRSALYDELVIETPCRIRVFKDLSTMIIIDDNISIGGSQSILVYPA